MVNEITKARLIGKFFTACGVLLEADFQADLAEEINKQYDTTFGGASHEEVVQLIRLLEFSPVFAQMASLALSEPG